MQQSSLLKVFTLDSLNCHLKQKWHEDDIMKNIPSQGLKQIKSNGVHLQLDVIIHS